MKLITTLSILSLMLSSLTSCSAAQDIPLVQGFPDGESVLNKTSVPHQQPEPQLVYKNKGYQIDVLSKVPKVGIHPRVLMSPADVPRIRQNIEKNAFSKIFWEQYILPMVMDTKKGEMKPISKARIDAAALYALVKDDAEYGKKVATELVKQAQKVSELFKENDATKPYWDNWWISGTRDKVSKVAQAYDFVYNFMTDKQRNAVRAVIAQATAGRYNHGMELPRSWRTWNWPQFSQNMVNDVLAIEGEEGYDPRILEVCREAVTDFQTYKIGPNGWDFESTGYNGLAYGGGGVQSLHAIARRTSPSILTHPHLQAKIAALVAQQATPTGTWYGRGDAAGGPPQQEFTHLMRAAYPNDQRWQIQWVNSFGVKLLSEGKINKKSYHLLRNSLGLPMLLFAVDQNIDPDALWNKNNGPLTFESPTRGYMATRSGWDAKNDIHLTYASYTKMRDTGHDGPDAGTFSLAGQGENWTRIGDKYHKESAWRNYIAINGGGMKYGTAPGLWLPTVDKKMATSARSDQSYAFSWRIQNGRYNVLYSPMFEEDPYNYLNTWARNNARRLRGSEPDATPFSREFWSMASTNYGLWNGEDRHPTRRIENLPVERAFRSVTMVRGDHPYVLTVDDIQVDDQKQLYTWLMTLTGQNEVVSKTKDLHKDFPQIILRRASKDGAKLQKGEPLMLVRVLQRNFDGFPTIRLDIDQGESGNNQRIIVPSMSVAPDFKVLLYPHRHGDPLPITKWNATKTSLSVDIAGQSDRIDFASAYVDRRPMGGHGEETYYTITRDDSTIITVGGPPSLPRPISPAKDFIDSMEVAFESPNPGQLIHYTTDGSEPTSKSPVYSGPITIDRSTEFRAITVAPEWAFGDAKSANYRKLVNTGFIKNIAPTYKQKVSIIDPKASTPVSIRYTKVPAAAPVTTADTVSSGIELALYELPITMWRGSKIDLKSPLMPEDLDKLVPIYRSYQQNLKLPRIPQTVEQSKMYQGLYVISAYVNAPVAGTYDFSMLSCGPTKLTVAGKVLVDIPGPYHTRLTERQGRVILKAGLHRLEAIAADPIFFTSATVPVVNFDLKMKAPGTVDFVSLDETHLFRDKDLAFNISSNYVELGQPLVIENQGHGDIQISLDGGKSYQPYLKPLVFDDTINVDLKIRRGANGPVIDKPLHVIAKLKALESLPVLKAGMIRRSYLHNVPMALGFSSSNQGKQIISYPTDSTVDNFAMLKQTKPQEVLAVSEMINDKVGGIIRTYTGMWRAPENGVYEFSMNYEGCSKLEIGGLHVASNNNKNGRTEGKVMLEQGWHELTVMFVAARPQLFVKGPRATKPTQLQVNDFFYDAQLEQKSFTPDVTGKPASFVMGAWFGSDDQTQVDTRLTSEIFGAKALVGERPGAHQFSGDKSMILVRDAKPTSKSCTISMWIKPNELKGMQWLWNRQNVGWVYTQRGGIALNLKNDQIGVNYHGQNRQPITVGTVKTGIWQHLAMTIDAKPGDKTQVEVWLNGQRIYSDLYGKGIDIPVTYMEFFGQVNRQNTETLTTGGLDYDGLKDLLGNCYSGAAADVRYFDAALPDAAIKVLAGK
ncbi:chitobiase/beta-hexosaminidase C-terminal domain-containing protein [Lentisphaera araneosa]|nr:chitobiase/beta-hexosaminidase C-terminal domain-containing protein [Lentisphaera araneosa]